MIGASVGSVGIALWNLTPTAIQRGITLRCLLPSSPPFTIILLDSIEATVNPSPLISRMPRINRRFLPSYPSYDFFVKAPEMCHVEFENCRGFDCVIDCEKRFWIDGILYRIGKVILLKDED